jgi:predicted nucleic acid-binding protein
MPAFVDTSVLIRYLVADRPEMVETAQDIVDHTEDLALTDIVLAETAFVLRSFYGLSREVIVERLTELVRKKNIRVHGLRKDTVVKALGMCRPSGRVSPADALLWAVAHEAGSRRAPSVVYSFDRRFPTDGVDVREGPAD